MVWPALLAYPLKPKGPRYALPAFPVVGMILGLIGPFGSYVGMGTPARIAHFVICVTAIGTMITGVSVEVARRWFGGVLPVFAAGLLYVALAVPSALIVSLSLSLFEPRLLAYVPFWERVAQCAGLNLMFGLAVLGLSLARDRLAPKPQPRPKNPLAEHLPPLLRGARVQALSAEDHYLRVYTSAGEALIHMKISQAVALMGAGFQLHRSHWVAEGLVAAEKDGEVVLKTGLTLPVARQRRKALQDWLGETPHD